MIHTIRKDFPFLSKTKKPLIYLDNAATTQKPQHVIDTINTFYELEYATIHRGIYQASEKATERYEKVRDLVGQFISADKNEIVFTSGATHAINLVAFTWGEENIFPGDEIIVSEMEHHSNLIAWQELAKKKKATLKFIPMTSDGKLDMTAYDKLLSSKTKLVAVTHVSNVLGTINPVDVIINKAHVHNARVLIDAAQSIPHKKIDVKQLNPDFLVFSGHKMLAPTGVGVLYMKKEIMESIPPYQFGGGMVHEASLTQATYHRSPQKFEAGTPPIVQVLGLGASISYLNSLNREEIEKHEALLTKTLINELEAIPQIKMYGPLDQLKENGHLVTFGFDGLHAHDVAAYFDTHNIAIRAGDFCAQPLIKQLGVKSLLRISFYLYNNLDEVQYLLDVLRSLCKK